ncbi:MAG: Rieske (2Fe-2S) protein [Geovibrio sp.]|uniref:QcrA and Rieske domain-containing protein n=1 Tax=Geovibrio ferrireducens TaxID=46201 RepID=UPI002248748F|nr:Rieske (2Fe-2S) protein [Geovibrio ferrireducens]MCD8492953.1 Rieske (2Fe-2S) protein [Geovibrio sp.]MCD8568020.1 Rieske (2Fe-2S) protein [Geovibrio sp.]
MTEQKSISRRGFLGRLAALAASAFSLWFIYRFLTPASSGGEILVQAQEADIPEGGAVIFPDKNIAVMRMDGAVSAMSLVCTHLGCTIALDGDRFACPCHGSIFALDGTVIKGPAERRLDTYRTETADGMITVFRQVNA